MALRLSREIKCLRDANATWDCIARIGQTPPKWAPIISASLDNGKLFFLWDNAGIPTLHGEGIYWKSYVLLDVIHQPNSSRVILKLKLSYCITAIILSFVWALFMSAGAYANRTNSTESAIFICAGAFGVMGYLGATVASILLGKTFLDRLEIILRDQLCSNSHPGRIERAKAPS